MMAIILLQTSEKSLTLKVTKEPYRYLGTFLFGYLMITVMLVAVPVGTATNVCLCMCVCVSVCARVHVSGVYTCVSEYVFSIRQSVSAYSQFNYIINNYLYLRCVCVCVSVHVSVRACFHSIT